MNNLTHIDLFSGIGGFSLAWKWCGGTTTQFVEIDPFCQKILQKNFPGVPIHDDIKTFKYTGQEHPFLLTGGFPCQPFSCAKHGIKSKVEDFSGYITRTLKAIKPTNAIIENVSENIIERVEGQLRGIGYGAFRRSYSARQFGADHLRNRWFAIAHPNHKSEFQGKFDAKMAIMQGMENCFWRTSNYSTTVRMDDGISEELHKLETSDRVGRLKALGNAIVPQVVYGIMQAIIEIERGDK